MKLLKSIYSHICFLSLLLILPFTGFSQDVQQGVNHQFKISFASSAHEKPITGRVFLILSKTKKPEPRNLAGSYFKSVPFWGKDISQLEAGAETVLDTAAVGYPVENLRDLPAGDYYIQAMVNVYTHFNRSDGHDVWLPMDHWEGQHFNRSPGNVISPIKKIHYDPAKKQSFTVQMDSVLPDIEMPKDSKQVKHVKFKSPMLSKFWGHDMYLGATVLLPKGYEDHPNAHYPVVYKQGHFNLGAPYGFTLKKRKISPAQQARLDNYNRESGYKFQEAYNGDDFPRMIVVTFQHPTPYYDDSYAVNSANNGPYGDAVMKELIPYVENHYRIIQQPYARMLTGGSTGGWESMALQIYHPDFFGGTWSLYPDPLDFHRFQLIDLYNDDNAFFAKTIAMAPERQAFYSPWQPTERFMMRDNDGQPVRTVQQLSQMEAALGSHGRSGQQFNIFDAVFGPVGKDGYPKPLWDKQTGKIDSSVVNYARRHGFDLRAYLQQNWSDLGPKLKDKLHVYVGDGDNFYLNLAVYKFQDFLQQTEDPHVEGSFKYGRPMKGHGWQPFESYKLLQHMAHHITKHAPQGADVERWKY